MKKIEDVYHKAPTNDSYSYWLRRKLQKGATDRREVLARKVQSQKLIRQKEAELELQRLLGER